MAKTLAMTVHVDGKVYKAGESVDADVAKQITNPKAFGESASADAPAEDEGTTYSSMSKGDLESEIATRNEGRDEADLISPAGKNKPDLVAALAADDAARGE